MSFNSTHVFGFAYFKGFEICLATVKNNNNNHNKKKQLFYKSNIFYSKIKVFTKIIHLQF